MEINKKMTSINVFYQNNNLDPNFDEKNEKYFNIDNTLLCDSPLSL